uniref:Suppressor of white apricot N-terminal domain-containing protein n=1 Tax=Petromyzon marinus TaxID=7757 RepID=S4R4S1_PETMA
MVDYKKRVERRREYYEKIKKDPAQFLQVQGRECTPHRPRSPTLPMRERPCRRMPWQGDSNNMIDRFDVRAHLDFIPEFKGLAAGDSVWEDGDERRCNYERYRCLVQNEFAGISEEQCLYQIYMDELYGTATNPRILEEEKKKLAEKRATIGYTYEDSSPVVAPDDAIPSSSSTATAAAASSSHGNNNNTWRWTSMS